MVAQIHRPAVTNYHGRQSHTVGDTANVISNGQIDMHARQIDNRRGQNGNCGASWSRCIDLFYNI